VEFIAMENFAMRWQNFHAFAAASEAAGLHALGLYFGLLRIVYALERTSNTIVELEIHVPAAAEWLIHTSRLILNSTNSDVGDLWGKDSEDWKGPDGISKDRWVFWKMRLEHLRLRDDLRHETRDIARKAQVAMEKAERSAKLKK
jgi:hypothetical protein